MDARLIVGLEIHVQLATRTKLFCGCALGFGAPPNSLTCPVCLGHPGTLPVINREALTLAARAALALHLEIAPFTKWDRKSYWYPDLPKNYQISQYDLPLGRNGHIDIPCADGGTRRIRIHRAHIEEDAGKNFHEAPGVTWVDLNRTGTPLLEIVTEPDLASPEEAGALARELQRIVRYVGASVADMQKGHMRFEPTINCEIASGGRRVRTPMVEVKNLNSFRALEAAIAFEKQRQVETYRADPEYTVERLGKQNRGWDDAALVTLVQRHKEEAHEYRYFPDPDLPPVTWTAAQIADLRASLPEMPALRQRRLSARLGLSMQNTLTIVEDRATGDLFEAALAAGACGATLAKHFLGFWLRHANERGTTIGGLGLDPARLAELTRMVADGTISATAAQQIAEAMLHSPEPPRAIAAREGLEQVSDRGTLMALVEQAIAANPGAVGDYLAGGKKRQKAFGFLQGQVMRLSRGSAQPALAAELLREKLGEPA